MSYNPSKKGGKKMKNENDIRYDEEKRCDEVIDRQISLLVNFGFKLKYQGKGIDPKTTIYNLSMSSWKKANNSFEGQIHKHNGQFVYVSLYFNFRNESINFVCEDVVLDNIGELKIFVSQKINSYISQINDINNCFRKLRFDDIETFELIRGVY